MTRWKLESTTVTKWSAKCKLCGRIAITKEDMSACPKGCHAKEAAEAVMGRAEKKANRKPQPTLLDAVEMTWERRD